MRLRRDACGMTQGICPSIRLLALTLSVLLPSSVAAQTAVTIPAGTYVYGELDERVTSKKRETTVGDIVRARVWRDVIVDGRVLIKAGTPMMARVSHVKPAKIAGRKGEVFIDALSTRATDGSEVLLDGGYDKSGKAKKALAWSLFALVAWPLVFIKGKQAILDPGTVFDASLQADCPVTVERAAGFRLKLADVEEQTLTVEVLYDEMDPDAKQKRLPLRLTACGVTVDKASVVTVNEQQIPPIPLVLTGRAEAGDCTSISATMALKSLAKHFRKGINRFTVDANGASGEIILEIEL